MTKNLIFWGVRGSFPISSRDMIKYGGNTSCISLQLDDDNLLIIDAGSGIKNLGDSILKNYEKKMPRIHILVSHFMWDHIMGIPFFKPIYNKDTHIHFYSAKRSDGMTLKEIFSVQHSRDYFHIDFVEIDARLHFHTVDSYKPFRIQNAVVTPVVLNHADITYGYIIKVFGKKIAYLNDTAPFHTEFLGSLPNPKYSKTKYLNYIKEQLFKYMDGSNIVCIDAHFSENEYSDKHNWGHSTPDYAVEICNKCGVQNLFLCHHAPEHDDETIDKLVEHARKINKNPGMNIFGAKENMTIKIITQQDESKNGE